MIGCREPAVPASIRESSWDSRLVQRVRASESLRGRDLPNRSAGGARRCWGDRRAIESEIVPSVEAALLIFDSHLLVVIPLYFSAIGAPVAWHRRVDNPYRNTSFSQ